MDESFGNIHMEVLTKQVSDPLWCVYCKESEKDKANVGQ